MTALNAHSADAQRGLALYELRCGECHSVSVHGRPHRAARNYEDVRGYVTYFSSYLGGYWRPDDISDVTKYLNDNYYGFTCGGPAC